MDVKIYDKLAKKYDIATKIVSFGIEEFWRWMFVREIKKHIKDGLLIDVASATGETAKKIDFKKMYLIEPSSEMNKIACEKFKIPRVVVAGGVASNERLRKKLFEEGRKKGRGSSEGREQ